MANAAAYPAFFKILTMKDFSTVLRIPPAFSTKHKSDMTGNAKLVVDCRRIWNVKMERNGSVFYFTRGWSKFVEDAALQFRDESRLVYGKIYSFEFDPIRKVILVKEKESD